MTIGELDTNLFTNQSLVGTTLESNSDKTIIEIEFYDYLGQPIIPTESVVKNEDTENQFNVTTTPSSITIGRYTGNNPYHAMFSVENNKLIATGAVTTKTTLITLMYHFRFLEVQTSEKSYTKFRYIQ